jgi:hypothetical protein
MVTLRGAMSSVDWLNRIEPRHRLVRLSLTSTRRFPDGVVHLNYRVSRAAPGKKAAKKFYCRIHSPVILIEFDHQRPANLARLTADPNQTGRQDLLRQHYQLHPHTS